MERLYIILRKETKEYREELRYNPSIPPTDKFLAENTPPEQYEKIRQRVHRKPKFQLNLLINESLGRLGQKLALDHLLASGYQAWMSDNRHLDIETPDNIVEVKTSRTRIPKIRKHQFGILPHIAHRLGKGQKFIFVRVSLVREDVHNQNKLLAEKTTTLEYEVERISGKDMPFYQRGAVI